MRKKEAFDLLEKLYTRVEPYYKNYGYKGSIDKKEMAFYFKKEPITIVFLVTSYSVWLSIRSHFRIIFPDLFKEVQDVVKIRLNPDTPSADDFSILNNGFFSIDQKLANLFGVSDYDQCEENGYKWLPPLKYAIETEADIEYTAKHQFEMMEKYGWQAVKSCENIDSYYEFMKRVFIISSEFRRNPNVREIHSPAIFGIGPFLSFLLLALRRRDEQVYIVVNLYLESFSETETYIEAIKKIINYVDKDLIKNFPLLNK